MASRTFPASIIAELTTTQIEERTKERDEKLQQCYRAMVENVIGDSWFNIWGRLKWLFRTFSFKMPIPIIMDDKDYKELFNDYASFSDCVDAHNIEYLYDRGLTHLNHIKNLCTAKSGDHMVILDHTDLKVLNIKEKS